MISSRADFFFFSALDSKLEDVSFLFVDAAAALRALGPREELPGDTNNVRQNDFIKPAELLSNLHSDSCTLIWKNQLRMSGRPG